MSNEDSDMDNEEMALDLRDLCEHEAGHCVMRWLRC
jgi:hypothetical protein